MIALVRYQLALLGHSQRYLMPALLFIGMLTVLYSDNEGPALPGFAVTAGALMVVSGWLTIALVDTEDPVQHALTRVHSGSLSRLIAGTAVTLVLCCLPLGGLSVLWAVLSHRGPAYPVRDILIGLLAHFVCACAGVSVSLPCSGLLIRRAGYSVVSTGLLLGIVLLAGWVPLAHPLLAAMSIESVSLAVLLRTMIVALLAVCASTVLVTVLRAKRD